jgi:hypothetical protein
MGIRTEICAELEATRLHAVLTAAMKTGNSSVIAFCNEHLVPLFDHAVSESFGSYKGDRTVRDAMIGFDGDLSRLQSPKTDP